MLNCFGVCVIRMVLFEYISVTINIVTYMIKKICCLNTQNIYCVNEQINNMKTLN